MIRDLEVNQVVTIPLLVKAAVARETKAKKPYLYMELFDGVDTINGNYWDWGGANIPAKNAVLNVKAQVTEWQGAKQLNIKALTTNTEIPVSDFMPSSGISVDKIYNDAYALMTYVNDDFLRGLALSLLEDLSNAWLTVPGAMGVHHAYTAGTLIHSYSVACIAKAMAENIAEANVDLCVVGGMLHDIGKLYTYKFNCVAIDMTDVGMLYEHSFIGAEFVGNYADNNYDLGAEQELKLEMLRHIILSHHGKPEYGAVVTPKSIEAYIVHHADNVDAETEQIRAQSAKTIDAKWTARIWALSNRPHLSTQYVADVMKSDTVDKE